MVATARRTRLRHRAVVAAAALLAVAGAAAAQGVPLDTQLPDWARQAWTPIAKARGLALSGRLNPFIWRGDFDGDGRPDVALLVRHTASGKEGIVLLLRRNAAPIVVGAGRSFGNGGDDFAWMDWWSVDDRAGASAKGGGADALVVGKEGAASALITLSRGKPTWRQQGD